MKTSHLTVALSAAAIWMLLLPKGILLTTFAAQHKKGRANTLHQNHSPALESLLQKCFAPLYAPSFKPQRIASLSLASDETLYELLRRSHSLHRLAAVSSMAHDLRYSFIAGNMRAEQLPQAAAHMDALIKLAPDWVVAARFNNPKFLQALQRVRLPYVVLEGFNNIEDIRNHTRSLARLIGEPQLGEDLIRDFLHWQPFTEKSESVLFYDAQGYVLGSQTLFDDLIRTAGLRNAVVRAGWWKIAAESLLSLHPDYIISTCHNPKTLLQELRRKVGWRHLEAVRQGKLLCVEQRALHSTSFYIHHAYLKLKSGYLALQEPS